jgi:hypothetical protein
MVSETYTIADRLAAQPGPVAGRYLLTFRLRPPTRPGPARPAGSWDGSLQIHAVGYEITDGGPLNEIRPTRHPRSAAAADNPIVIDISRPCRRLWPSLHRTNPADFRAF